MRELTDENKITLLDPTAARFFTLRKVFLIAVGVGVLFGCIGPFGTFQNLPLAARLGYWIVLLVGGALFFPATYQMIIWRMKKSNIPYWGLVTAVSGIGAFPMTLLVWATTKVFYGEAIPLSLALYACTALIAFPTVLIHHFVIGQEFLRPNPAVDAFQPSRLSPKTPTETRNILIERLPHVQASEILCLQVEDHYVRVYTANANYMVLMRFSDAIAAMHGIDGVQVHRSWWIAYAAIKAVHKNGRKLKIELVNSIIVPVSREGSRASLASIQGKGYPIKTVE